MCNLSTLSKLDRGLQEESVHFHSVGLSKVSGVRDCLYLRSLKVPMYDAIPTSDLYSPDYINHYPKHSTYLSRQQPPACQRDHVASKTINNLPWPASGQPGKFGC